MALAEIALGVELLGSWMQGSSERRALQKQLEYLQQYYAPELAARQMLMERLGKESPRLAAAHRKSLQRLDQSEAAELATVRARGKRTGVARSGEEARVRATAEEARGAEAFTYAEKQQAEIDKVVSSLLGRGEAGPAIAGAMGQLGSVESGLFGQIGEAVGGYAAGKEMAPLLNAQKEWYESEAGGGGGGDVGAAGALPRIPEARRTLSGGSTLPAAPAPTEPLVPPDLRPRRGVSPIGSGVETPPYPEEWDEFALLDASEIPNRRLPSGGNPSRRRRYGLGLRPGMA